MTLPQSSPQTAFFMLFGLCRRLNLSTVSKPQTLPKRPLGERGHLGRVEVGCVWLSCFFFFSPSICLYVCFLLFLYFLGWVPFFFGIIIIVYFCSRLLAIGQILIGKYVLVFYGVKVVFRCFLTAINSKHSNLLPKLGS